MNQKNKMRTLFTLLCLICQMDSKAQNLEITWETHELEYNNHVGNEWGFGIEANKTIFAINEPVVLTANKKTNIRVFVQEIDTYTEEVSHWIEIDPTKMEFGKSYTKELEFVVKENMGRYTVIQRSG